MFNVLLVDDEHLSIVALQHMIPWEQFGFSEIHTTMSPVKALDMLKSQKFDACFVDVNMPELSGLDLLKTAKQLGLDTKFVVVSGYSDFSYAQQAISYDVVGYCLKPVDRSGFMPTMERLCQKVMDNRCKRDPAWFSEMLSNVGACERFVEIVRRKLPESKELNLMLVRGERLQEKLLQISDAVCDAICFLKENEALLAWGKEDHARWMKGFLVENKLHARMVCGTCECTAAMLQKMCLKMFRVFKAQSGASGEVVVVTGVNEQIEALVRNVMAYIDSNYTQDISLQTIAGKFGVNYSYLSRVLNRQMGISFAEYLTNKRLKKACQLLEDTLLQIAEISKEVGFVDYHYFTRTFKKYYGVTPTQYRDEVRKG